ncbi:LacI family DNA-binding transcriptional regulator [Jiangella alkaliphila]|uniref:Transcriptional regulator, LacI family n=1 Tax=Jiangella alkaliphila TaxID=419479 RepID=A0A1H2LDP2_9ACTN|nr:LacI family DNA-binding transcriptional regulator [Jiangella alkaliphila]SDU79039.1 transcriptional regulator, LacI family [Jiangella alkaliphila]
MPVTRRDVAKLAGTSPAVVSYVLNGGPRGVAPETRERVLAAIEELGYRPNRIAASLRRNRTMTIGLVVPDNTNPYFAELAHAVEDAAFDAGYTLLLGNAGSDVKRETSYVRTFLDSRVDGLVLIPSGEVVASAGELAESGTPWVVLDRLVDHVDGVAGQLVSDNRHGGRLATEHLLWHGRTRIGCITGPGHVANFNERVLGWRDALGGNGRDATAAALRETEISRFAARDAARDLLQATPGIDGVFAVTDEQALGVLRALMELGLRCPDDVALVSFDGIDASSLTTPGLSTVGQSIRELATSGVSVLLDAIERDDDAPAERAADPARPLVFPVHLTPRGSCGCPDVFESATRRDTGGRR